MPAWVRVYLKKPVELTTAAAFAALEAAMRSPDWYTLGELLGLDEAAVDAFMTALEWSASDLEIRCEGRRPLQFWILDEPSEIRESIEELDDIAGLVIPPSVRRHMKSVVMIVAIEMAFTQLETMFEAVAFEVMYWLAETGRGVIRGPHDDWFDHGKHRWKPIVA